MGRGPRTPCTRRSGPPCSISSCRQRPHGVTTSPLPVATSATSCPPPVKCKLPSSEHSAHKVSPSDAFSTLQPTTIRPSSTNAAAPTRKREYGAYARRPASIARRRRCSQSISRDIRPIVGERSVEFGDLDGLKYPSFSRVATHGLGWGNESVCVGPKNLLDSIRGSR